MAQKPLTASAASPQNAPKPEHPAIQLFRRLNDLNITCGNAHIFVDLRERRAAIQASRDQGVKLLLDRANEQANKLRNAGASSAEVFATFEAVEKYRATNLPNNEPPELTTQLCELLKQAMSLCDAAQNTLREGGAKALDATIKPNSAGQPRSIAIHLELQEAKSFLRSLNHAVRLPELSIGAGPEKMEQFAKRCRDSCNELAAVFEIHGLDVPANLPATPNTVSNATGPTMRDLATAAGISDDTFRRVRDDAEIVVELKGAAARNRRYSPTEIDRLIAAALAGNRIERTAMAEKWARWGSK